MKPYSIFALIVIYNKHCSDSLTCRGLSDIKDKDINIILYDNSTHDYENRPFCEEKGWLFMGGEGNEGLSKAYNKAVKYCRKKDSDAILCLFDDDSTVSVEYFESLKICIEDHPECAMYFPILTFDKGILSPAILNKNGSVSLFSSREDLERYDGPDLTALNSGMALSLHLFDHYQYDENLFLDCIDHKFMDDMKKRDTKYSVMDYEFSHNLSSQTRPQLATSLARYKIFLHDVRYYHAESDYVYFRLIIRRALRLTVEHRSTVFLKAFFNRDKKKEEGTSRCLY